MANRLFILIDYRDQFYFSTRHRGACIDVNRLGVLLKERGWELVIKHFYEIDFRKENYKGEWVLYQSSEDPNLNYKDYIEDVLLSLHLQGAKLVPEFKYFRAHHNKVFMELIRDTSAIPEIKNIISRGFGTYEEYLKSNIHNDTNAYVLKPGSGTRSNGVKLLASSRDKSVHPNKISRTFTLTNLAFILSKIKIGKPFTPISNNRRKFIVQNFVPGLNGDYRILAYGNKFYVVYRGNRENDFRASGSGKLNFEAPLPEGLLDYAKSVYKQFSTPYMSLDIGCKDGEFYLFEFQCLCLGQYTLEKSTFYYKQVANTWERVYEPPNLEREIATTVFNYISAK